MRVRSTTSCSEPAGESVSRRRTVVGALCFPCVACRSHSSAPCRPMPLTIAHAAVAWPISRCVPWLPVVPLVIGTLIPDAGYLIDLAPGRSFGHSIFGAMTVGLALTLVLWWLYEAWVKPTLLRRLPNEVRISVGRKRTAEQSGSYAFLGALAGLLGSASHIAWDSLTHSASWPGSLLAPFGSVPQDVSTVAGLAALIVLTYRWTNAHPRAAWSLLPDEQRRLLNELVFGATVTSLVVAWGVIRAHSAGPRHVLGAAAVSAMAGGVLSIALVVARDHLGPRVPRLRLRK